MSRLTKSIAFLKTLSYVIKLAETSGEKGFKTVCANGHGPLTIKEAKNLYKINKKQVFKKYL